MDSKGRPSGPAPLRSAARSAAVVAPLRSASSTSAGHGSDTSHAVAASSPGSLRKQYPPTPSTPL
eukprot:5248238-Pleurochrysis_carterae.AAC.1